MARGGSGGGSKGGAQTVPYGGGNIANNRYRGGLPQPAYESRPTGIVAGGPNPYGAGNDLGASAGRIISDMRYNHNIGGYQGLPKPQPFRPQIQPYQPQPFQNRFGSPVYSAPYQPQPMPFRAPSPGKGGSKGGGMSVPRDPRFRNEFTAMPRNPFPENPLGNRGGMMRTMEMRPGRDYIPFRPPARQMQHQAVLQGLGGFFR